MSDPLGKELNAPDVQAAAIQPTNTDRLTDSDEDRVEKTDEKDGDNISHIKDDDDEDEHKGPELRVTRTSASAATTATHATTLAPAPEKKPWHKNLNPFRWGPPPPVPKEKITSREYEAGFFSLLTFQWMAPLMTVSCPYHFVAVMRDP